MKVFIDAVREQPCLWNPLHRDYRDPHKKDDAWQHVVLHCNHDSIRNIQVAKIEWKKLRDNHRDALKRAKLGKNKLLPAQVTTWKYAKAMQFLEPHMKYRITENIEMEPSVGFNSKNSDHDVSTTEQADVCEPASKRRCFEGGSTASKNQLETDALESFFNCMLQSTREMPQWMQTQVKKRIFGIIIEAEESLSAHNECKNNQFDVNVTIEPKIKSENVTDYSSDNEY